MSALQRNKIIIASHSVYRDGKGIIILMSDVLTAYLHSVALAEYISPKKIEGGRKFSFNVV